MTMDEWVAAYNRKNPQAPFERDDRYALFFQPEHGFCEVMFTDEMTIINQLGGEAGYWKAAVSHAAGMSGIHIGGTWCIRNNIVAYLRLFGYGIDHTEELKDGLKRYYVIHKKTKKKGLASPAFRYADGRQAYFVTWEI